MEARAVMNEDEIASVNQIVQVYKNYPRTPGPSGRNELGEILYRAGRDAGVEAGKALGRAEVVAWMEKQHRDAGYAIFPVDHGSEWQNQLKAWGQG
ncbi:hypothetical protein LCGC14_0853210 [marine sediment metagenome]|uniref:Uncharacterized protein n=1 Tax=marine sediment metagenome TaxID=412755 RepID=A0A0F9PEH8_9ZZZZ